MAESLPVVPISAEQVAILRRRTGRPWMECKRALASLLPTERARYIESIETNPGGIFHDPIEDDPAVRPLFLAACEDADREVQEWHSQQIAEMELSSPEVADLFRSGRGLCHRTWYRIKELMRERHGLEWRSPREINPGAMFD